MFIYHPNLIVGENIFVDPIAASLVNKRLKNTKLQVMTEWASVFQEIFTPPFASLYCRYFMKS